MKNIRFEWDENKNKINKKKHGLSFEEAVEVFGDETLSCLMIQTIRFMKTDFSSLAQLNQRKYAL